MMEKYGVVKEVVMGEVRFQVPLNATEEEIIREGDARGVEFEKMASWKEVDDGGTESVHIRSEQSTGEN